MKIQVLVLAAILHTTLTTPYDAQEASDTPCVKVGASYLESPRDAGAISESIVEILRENLPEAWSCVYDRTNYWLLYGVTVALVDNSERGRRRFDAYLSHHFWYTATTEPWTPRVILALSNYTSVREAAEDFELRIRRDHRDVIEELQR